MTTVPAPPLRASTDRILLGIMLMLAFCLMAPMLDVASKLATEEGLPVGEITLSRFAVQGLMMLPVVLAMGVPLTLSGRALVYVLARAFLLILSTFTFVSALRFMPIADALAVAFVEPFILLILGRLIFGDHVGPRRILACLVGFGGAMLVIQPSIAAFGLVALWPLGTAFSFAFYMLVTRAMSAWMHPVAMQFHTSWAGVALFAPVLLVMADGPVAALRFVMPEGIACLWLIGVGFWACLSHMCMTFALKFAPASTLGPLHYTEIVVAVIMGYLIWGDLPRLMSWIGIAVIVSSGLYIVHRERLAA